MRALGSSLLGLGLILAGLPGAMPLAEEPIAAAPSSGVEDAQVIASDPVAPTPSASRRAGGSLRGLAQGPEADGGDPGSGIPIRLVIPAIALDAPIVPAGSRIVVIGGRRYREWLAPDRYAAGWHPTSARAGAPGNLVLSGHNNIAGAVFRRLADLQIGDRIWVYTREHAFVYAVVERRILLERGQPLTVRAANARWIQDTPDECLTLVTCWPPWSNSHRLVVVARPVRP